MDDVLRKLNRPRNYLDWLYFRFPEDTPLDDEYVSKEVRLAKFFREYNCPIRGSHFGAYYGWLKSYSNRMPDELWEIFFESYYQFDIKRHGRTKEWMNDG